MQLDANDAQDNTSPYYGRLQPQSDMAGEHEQAQTDSGAASQSSRPGTAAEEE